MLVAILVALAVVLLILWVAAPRTVPWVDHLTRLNAGAGTQAEWMAPPQVVEDVIVDYRAALDWLETCAAHWGRFAEGLERYTTGSYFKYQRRTLATLVDARPRLAVTLSAHHAFAVRHFTPDGLRCLLVDRQTQRCLTTASYWSGRTLHTQALDDTALVFQMHYDIKDKRWKIERLIQELPLGSFEIGEAATGKKARVKLTTSLPVGIGRDG